MSLELPPTTRDPMLLFENEHAFCDYLMSQPGLWYRMGMYLPHAYRIHTTPDFLTYCRPINRKAKNPKKVMIGVEAEMTPSTFKTHGHDPFNIGLVICLSCWWPIRKVKSVDIVSFYRRNDKGIYVSSLDDDISVLFHGRRSELFNHINDEPSEDGEDDSE